MSRLESTLQRCSILLEDFRCHVDLSCNTTSTALKECAQPEITEADMLQLKLQGLRLALPGFKFRQICQAQCTDETILNGVGWIFLKLSKCVYKGATGFKHMFWHVRKFCLSRI